jgi:hypothetical protein
LRRIRAGPVELEWDQLIESTAKQISDVGPVVDTKPKRTVRQDLDAIATTVPAAAVLEAFARLERRLREKTQTILDTIPKDSRRRAQETLPALARLAYSNGLVPKEIQDAILNLSRLRNEAAHRVGGDDITTEQAREYLDLVDSVLEAIN